MNRQQKEQSLLLKVDPDKLHASLVCVKVNIPGCFDNILGAREALRNASIMFGLDNPLLQETLEKLDEMQLDTEVVIAKCQEPVDSVDGRIEFFVDVSGQAKYSGHNQEEASIDFRSATSVTCVDKSELLAKVFPSIPGKPGRNVCGEAIPPRQPKEAAIRAGSNVNFDKKDNTYTSSENGRPIFADQILSVLPVYEVSGDVDYETGHIKFAGSVFVRGNVLSDFNIDARDIEIDGTVGACHLTATNNIIIRGGINGTDRAVIKAGGSVTAKYINNTTVECLGDINSARGILNSNIMCNGKVLSTSLIGGRTCARMGMEIKDIGSEMGVSTQLEPGVDLLVRKIDNVLDVIDAEIEKQLSPHLILLEDPKKYRSLSEERKDTIKADFENFKSLKEKHVLLATRRNELMQNPNGESLKEIIVFNRINADTIVRTEFCMRNFNTPINGPIKIFEDIASSTLLTKAYSPKDKKTAVVEKSAADKV